MVAQRTDDEEESERSLRALHQLQVVPQVEQSHRPPPQLVSPTCIGLLHTQHTLAAMGRMRDKLDALSLVFEIKLLHWAA